MNGAPLRSRVGEHLAVGGAVGNTAAQDSMKKRPRRKASHPLPARRTAAPPEPVVLHYKVVELSTVDEATLEETINTWVHQGWTVESVHFAMRDASKRPAMAFVFFTSARPHSVGPAQSARGAALRDPSAAWQRLAELARGGEHES
jgi:hypothetical protein